MGKKLKIAVTGGMGSGKSTVCDYFREQGYTVIVSDDVAKDILVCDANVKQKIIKQFGKDSYKNGVLNRNYLSDKVFPDEKNVEIINAIVHPPTIKLINKIVNDELQKSNLVFVESALIFEAKMDKDYDHIILVTSEDKEKIKRVVERDNITADKVKKRLDNQVPEKQKKSKVDFVIENKSNIEDLKMRAAFILSILRNLTL